MSTFSDYFESSKTGCGVWYMNHFDLHYAKTAQELSAIVARINNLRNYYSCVACRGHFNEYLKKYDINSLLQKDLALIRNGSKHHHLKQMMIDSHTAANTHRYERLKSKGIVAKEPETITYQQMDEWFENAENAPCSKNCEQTASEKEATKDTVLLSLDGTTRIFYPLY